MLYELSRIGQGISPQGLAALLVLLVATVALIVLVEGAGREVQVSRSDGSKQPLFFKLDRATIVPAYVASWAMAIPNVLAWLFSSGTGDYDYCLSLLEETGLTTVNGSGFGQREGTHHLRVAFLPPREMLEEVLPRWITFHNRYVNGG